MSGSILQAVARIKRNVAEVLSAESIEEVCRKVGHDWRQRRKRCGHFYCKCCMAIRPARHAVRLASLRCTVAAYCEARARLPLPLLSRCWNRVTRVVRRSCGPPRWHGHRTFLVDGSGLSMPDTPELQDHFGQPGQQLQGCGFPQAHLVAMFDAATGLLVKMLVTPLRTHDQSQVACLHPELGAGDVLVGDRGFCSYVHLALIVGRELQAVFRVHQRQLVSFRRIDGSAGRSARHGRQGHCCLLQKLGRFDQIVEYAKPPQCPTWMDTATFEALPETIIVRELRYRTGVRGLRVREITLVTTLLDPTAYPPSELAELYRQRWNVEVYQPEYPSSATLVSARRLRLRCRPRRCCSWRAGVASGRLTARSVGQPEQGGSPWHHPFPPAPNDESAAGSWRPRFRWSNCGRGCRRRGGRNCSAN